MYQFNMFGSLKKLYLLFTYKLQTFRGYNCRNVNVTRHPVQGEEEWHVPVRRAGRGIVAMCSSCLVASWGGVHCRSRAGGLPVSCREILQYHKHTLVPDNNYTTG